MVIVADGYGMVIEILIQLNKCKDSSRGGNKNLTTVYGSSYEDSGSHGIIDSFDSDGITVSNGTNSSFPRLYYNDILHNFGSSGGKYDKLALESKRGGTSTNHLIQTEV